MAEKGRRRRPWSCCEFPHRTYEEQTESKRTQQRYKSIYRIYKNICSTSLQTCDTCLLKLPHPILSLLPTIRKMCQNISPSHKTLRIFALSISPPKKIYRKCALSPFLSSSMVDICIFFLRRSFSNNIKHCRIKANPPSPLSHVIFLEFAQAIHRFPDNSYEGN